MEVIREKLLPRKSNKSQILSGLCPVVCMLASDDGSLHEASVVLPVRRSKVKLQCATGFGERL